MNASQHAGGAPHDTIERDRRPPRTKARSRLLMLLGVLLVIGLVAWGIIGRSSHLAGLRVLADEESVPQVQVVTPARGPQSRSLSLPGTIKAWYATPIYAQVSGYVKAWHKDYGATVKAGELLATIDAPGLDEQFEAARAKLGVAQAKYQLAQVTARRWKALSGTQAVSQQDVDTQASDATSQGAQVQAAEHDVARYQALEQFKRVVAPFDGVVTSRSTDVGDYVNAAGGDVGSHGGSSELFGVSDIHKMRVFVSVPQDYSAMLKPGLTATLSLPQFPGKLFKARFETTANAFNAATRTVVTELIVDNADRTIWPGTYTDVHFTTPANPDILIVPEQALLFSAEGIQVALVGADNRVHMQSVKLGLNFGQTVQILDGLKPTDHLVNNPSAGLIDGALVRVVPGVPGIAPEAQFRVAAQSAAGTGR